MKKNSKRNNNSSEINNIVEKKSNDNVEQINIVNIAEKHHHKRNAKLNIATEQMLEQLNLIRTQINNTRSIMQNKTHSTMENAKNQIIEITKKIESDIHNIENNVAELEAELLNTQDKVADHNISFFQELLRKAIHLCSLSIPIIYIFFSKETMLIILVPIMIIVVLGDIITKINPIMRTLYLKAFGFMLRKHEIQTKEMLLNGASWVMISAVLTIFFFPKIIAIVALSVLFISDIVAAIIGRKYGKKRFLGLKKKSWVGTIAFFISAMVVVSIYGYIFEMPLPYFFVGIVAAATAAIAEAIANEVLRTDDNLAIPISFGIMMWVGDAFIVNILNHSSIWHIN
jgi:dolichol kinase